MGKYLKYLLPLIMALAFWNCTDDSESTAAGKASEAIFLNEPECHSDISEPESKLFIPRKVSFAHRTQGAVRRTSGAQRNSFEFVKSGRIINADIRYFVQKKSIIIHSSLTEPGNRLLCLGRLII